MTDRIASSFKRHLSALLAFAGVAAAGPGSLWAPVAPVAPGASGAPGVAHDLPPGFEEEILIGGLRGAVELTHDDQDRLYVSLRDGIVYQFEDLTSPPNLLIDISEEVGNWRDFGMLGFTLDPDFAQNGFLYLFYVVDRHHLLYFGTPTYSATEDLYFDATIGRITRYQADSATNFTTLVPGSRTVLLGETIDTGVPILSGAHGTGQLAFGADGTLLASCGESGLAGRVDTGSSPNSYFAQALADGIIRSEENVGALSRPDDRLSQREDPASGPGDRRRRAEQSLLRCVGAARASLARLHPRAAQSLSVRGATRNG